MSMAGPKARFEGEKNVRAFDVEMMHFGTLLTDTYP